MNSRTSSKSRSIAIGRSMTAVFKRSAIICVLVLTGLVAPWGGASEAAGIRVHYEASFAPGTLVVHTGARKLYLVLENRQALQYPVGVGRSGKQWTGRSSISGKYIRPNWAPPEMVRRNQPDLPVLIEGGSPANPMGEAALTLSGGDYAIHGTNAPQSIGGFVSYGCIRMFNGDIVDLYRRVGVGTPVVVLH